MAKQPKNEQPEAVAPAPAFDLVALEPYGDIQTGQRIEDPELVARLIEKEPHRFTKVAKSG